MKAGLVVRVGRTEVEKEEEVMLGADSVASLIWPEPSPAWGLGLAEAKKFLTSRGRSAGLGVPETKVETSLGLVAGLTMVPSFPS
jgi:hypothetical protein